MTRLASSDAVMWRGILLSNRDNVLAAVHDFRGSLDGMAQALATADGEAIEQVIVRGREGVTV
jgi:prephenate dehydrogenase